VASVNLAVIIWLVEKLKKDYKNYNLISEYLMP